jgi:nuclear receptor subfamily 1 group I
VLKSAGGNVYEEHQRFLRSFTPLWRNDENIMLILGAITLFSPDRPNVMHKDVVKLEQVRIGYRKVECVYSQTKDMIMNVG